MLHGRGHGWLFQALNRALEECEPSPNDEASSQAERLELYLSTMGRLLRRERRLHQLDPRLQLLLVGLFQKLAMMVQRSEPACLLSIWSLQFCTLVLRQARPDDAFFGMLRPELETIQRSLLEQLPQVIQGSLSSTPLFQERQVFRERLARQAWAQHDAALALQETFGSLTLLESTWIRVAWRFLLMRYESQASSGAMPTNPPLMPTLLPEGLTSASPVPSPRLGGTQAVHADRQGLVAGQDTPEPLTLHQASIRVLLEQVLWHPRCFGGAVWSVAAQTLALAVNEDPANAAIFWEEHTVDGLRQVLAAAATADASTATCLPATAASYVAAWHALDALCIRREQLDALLEHHDQDDHGRQVLPTDHPEANNQQARRLPSMQSMLQSLIRAPLYRPVLARALFQSRHDLSQTKGLLKRGDEIPALYERVVFAELQTWLADRVDNRRPAELVDNAQRCLANMNGGTEEESRLHLQISMETTRLVTLEMAFVLLESLRKSMLSSSRLTGERHPSSSVTRAQLDQLQSSLWQEALVTLRFPLGLYLLSSTADRTHPAMFLLIQATESVRRHALGTGSVLDSGQVRRLLCEYLGQTLPNVLEQVSPVHCAVMKEDLASSTTRTKWVLRGASALDQVHLVGALGIVLLLLALMGQRFKQKYRFRTSTTTSQEVGQASAEGQVTDGTLVHAVGCLERLCRYALAQSGFETVTVYPIPLPSKRGLEMEVVMIEPLVEDEDEEQARDTPVDWDDKPEAYGCIRRRWYPASNRDVCFSFQ
ncbi:hypothetical protein F1559_004863 [Cyanidiococcus yangmingshanensis]|uniref:Uncharacterized protein n=1 Tax=Cyanidiococcus yangmingshanensis TaxID=2690220 RepID=A0A7J7INE4_9RHOD|nr:hypothetical protein F1559_004863 [Cyanidiococcus yangmingshanensis]